MAQNLTVVAVYQKRSDFVSASGDYTFYDIAHWINSDYQPVPFVRWDLDEIPPRSTINLNYQARIRLEAGWHELLEGGVHLIPTAAADDIFPVYDPTGDHD